MCHCTCNIAIELVIVNPRGSCAARVTVVAVSVCLSVKSHLILEASLPPENAVTYSTGDEGQKICGVFSETFPLQRSNTFSLGWPYIRLAIFLVNNTHEHFASSPRFVM